MLLLQTPTLLRATFYRHARISAIAASFAKYGSNVNAAIGDRDSHETLTLERLAEKESKGWRAMRIELQHQQRSISKTIHIEAFAFFTFIGIKRETRSKFAKRKPLIKRQTFRAKRFCLRHKTHLVVVLFAAPVENL